MLAVMLRILASSRAARVRAGLSARLAAFFAGTVFVVAMITPIVVEITTADDPKGTRHLV